MMRFFKTWLLLGAAFIFSNAAQAADMPEPVVGCVPRAQAALAPHLPVCAEEEFGGWYLRGDIGMTNQSVAKLDNLLYAGNTVVPQGMGFDSSPFFGLGVGYQFNSWLRVDLTGEYRGSASFHGLDIVNGNYTDEYRARKSEWTFLANTYFDLGTWNCITPFIGAGIGFSRNTISSFTDVSTTNAGVAYGATASKTNFAYALYAGLAYKVTPGFTVELAYRYLNLGDAQSGDLVTYNGINNFYNPMKFKDITSQDVKLGVRWSLDAIGSGFAQPVAPYQPAPVYAPPLSSRG